MDETGLFFRLEPNKSLTIHQFNGNKKNKEKITVALTSNMDGSMKLPLLIINCVQENQELFQAETTLLPLKVLVP